MGWRCVVALASLSPRGIITTDIDNTSIYINICLVHELGRTTCIGSRLARLNIKLVVALLLIDFDFDTVDEGGRIVDSPPKPNWNDPLGCRPAQGQFFLRYRRLDDPESRVVGGQD
jgi:hypothetical protein